MKIDPNALGTARDSLTVALNAIHADLHEQIECRDWSRVVTLARVAQQIERQINALHYGARPGR